MNIDYHIIANSADYYESKGFNRVESPWCVTKPVSDITRPPAAKDYQIDINNKVIVASGEQSFLYMYLKGFLPMGQFQTITPCWRYETFDSLHTKYFIKNELIETKTVTTERLNQVVEIAVDFFSKYFPRNDLEVTSDGISVLQMDIEYKGIELGSYGIRTCPYLEWIYATGAAEPRISSTIKRFELERRNNERLDCI